MEPKHVFTPCTAHGAQPSWRTDRGLSFGRRRRPSAWRRACLPNGTLKTYPGYSHGMLTVNADVLNVDLLAFVTS